MPTDRPLNPDAGLKLEDELDELLDDKELRVAVGVDADVCALIAGADQLVALLIVPGVDEVAIVVEDDIPLELPFPSVEGDVDEPMGVESNALLPEKLLDDEELDELLDELKLGAVDPGAIEVGIEGTDELRLVVAILGPLVKELEEELDEEPGATDVCTDIFAFFRINWLSLGLMPEGELLDDEALEALLTAALEEELDKLVNNGMLLEEDVSPPPPKLSCDPKDSETACCKSRSLSFFLASSFLSVSSLGFFLLEWVTEDIVTFFLYSSETLDAKQTVKRSGNSLKNSFKIF